MAHLTYKRGDEVQSAYKGSALADALAADPAWELKSGDEPGAPDPDATAGDRVFATPNPEPVPVPLSETVEESPEARSASNARKGKPAKKAGKSKK